MDEVTVHTVLFSLSITAPVARDRALRLLTTSLSNFFQPHERPLRQEARHDALDVVSRTLQPVDPLLLKSRPSLLIGHPPVERFAKVSDSAPREVALETRLNSVRLQR